MNERLLSIGGALAAVAITLALLVPTPTVDVPLSRPTSLDRGAFGYYALQQWLTDSAVPNESLRRRYDSLATLAPGSGHVLITVLPAHTPARVQELAALSRWVAAGNTVLVMIGASTAPPWAAQARDPGTALAKSLGFRATTAATSKDTDPTRQLDALLHTPSKTALLEPRGRHPLLTNVTHITGDAPSATAHSLEVKPLTKSRRLPALLRGSGARAEDLWLGTRGTGRVVVVADPALFANRYLGASDNAQLFNNLLALARGPRGRVVFDDMHQGLSDLYDPHAFARDPRVYASALFLLALWLAWVGGHGGRFVPRLNGVDAAATARFARAVGGLLARQVSAPETARALLASFARECRRRHPRHFEQGYSHATLCTLPGLPTPALRGLAAAERRLAAGASTDLIALCNHLRTLRMHL